MENTAYESNHLKIVAKSNDSQMISNATKKSLPVLRIPTGICNHPIHKGLTVSFYHSQPLSIQQRRLIFYGT
jgi:hypothetical protein|nr:MAG TPA_asm: hypothetical protein [Caudoviricetes sp.]